MEFQMGFVWVSVYEFVVDLIDSKLLFNFFGFVANDSGELYTNYKTISCKNYYYL